jgi:uncharacterized protein (TIGR02246 family)
MNAEEEAVVQATQEFVAAWNAGDAKKAASFYAEDGVRVGAFGDVQHGRIEIGTAFEKLLHQTMSGAHAEQERGSVRMLTSDLAVWQGRIEIVMPPPAPSMKGYVVQVMKKVADRWLVLEGHPKFFPPRPA